MVSLQGMHARDWQYDTSHSPLLPKITTPSRLHAYNGPGAPRASGIDLGLGGRLWAQTVPGEQVLLLRDEWAGGGCVTLG